MSRLDRSEGLHDFESGLRPDTGKSRHIVRAVPHQSLQLDEVLRAHSERSLNLRRRVALIGGLSPLRLRDHDPGMIVRKLQKVPVARQDRHLRAVLLRLRGQRAENVVCLPSLAGDNRNPHIGKQLLHHRHLLMKFLRRRRAVPLVLRVQPVAERRRGKIEGDRQKIRLFLLHNLSDNRQKAVYRVGVTPVGRRHRKRHTIKRTKQNTVSVNQ